MGICLDTEANSTAIDSEEAEWKRRGGGEGSDSRLGTARTTDSDMATANTGKVKFDPPSVPVIFVLGGPGSGKVTHCDTLMEEKRGVTHINMMDLLHQHVISNDMQDFSQLSSKMVTEVLMLEIKMAPAAKAYLISGFPRSMRDVVEYSDKIQVISGVVLIAWRQEILQKQIDYGVKLGQVVLSLAKMELENFYKNVIPVSEYFDQSGLLSVVNGERNPADVYKDFRSAVFEVLSSQDNQNAMLNGVVGMGRGMNEIPGTIVSVETAAAAGVGGAGGGGTMVSRQHTIAADIEADVEAETSEIIEAGSAPLTSRTITKTPPIEVTRILDNPKSLPNNNIDLTKIPPIIWVIGGPGSNKSTLCLKAVALNPGWSHFSIGRVVRAIAESDPKANTENHKIKNAIASGEMINKHSIQKILETHLVNLSEKKGIIIDGYPRDIKQVTDFEDKYRQKPPIILLDCSKLQLGRGRLDDTVSSFRRRLEQFRELTLPMLKVLDAEGRLSIVDGDTDSPSVQREFERVIRQHTSRLNHEIAYKADSAASKQSAPKPVQKQQSQPLRSPTLPPSPPKTMTIQRHPSHSNNQQQQQQQSQPQLQQHQQKPKTTQSNQDDAIVEDLDNMPGTVPTISNHISLIHSNTKSSIENDQMNNNNNSNSSSNTVDINHVSNHVGNHVGNHVDEAKANPTKTFRSMLEEAESYPIDEA